MRWSPLTPSRHSRPLSTSAVGTGGCSRRSSRRPPARAACSTTCLESSKAHPICFSDIDVAAFGYRVHERTALDSHSVRQRVHKELMRRCIRGAPPNRAYPVQHPKMLISNAFGPVHSRGTSQAAPAGPGQVQKFRPPLKKSTYHAESPRGVVGIFFAGVACPFSDVRGWGVPPRCWRRDWWRCLRGFLGYDWCGL